MRIGLSSHMSVFSFRPRMSFPFYHPDTLIEEDESHDHVIIVRLSRADRIERISQFSIRSHLHPLSQIHIHL